jgi:hypothetical protein
MRAHSMLVKEEEPAHRRTRLDFTPSMQAVLPPFTEVARNLASLPLPPWRTNK